MRRSPSPNYHRASVLRRSAITMAVIAVLVLVVVVLPLERAAVVAGLVGTVVASVAPAWLNGGRSTRRRVRGRSSDQE
jgi:hypothetical protein